MSALLDALARGQGQYRAVELLAPTATSDQIRKLDAAGVRGVRFNFVFHLNNVHWSQVQETGSLIAPLGWNYCITNAQKRLHGPMGRAEVWGRVGSNV